MRTLEEMRELEFLADILRQRRPGEDARDCADRRLVTAAMIHTSGNQTKAAGALGMALKTFKLLARDHRLRPCDRRAACS